MDRAHRMGQTREVKTFQLIASDTIEQVRTSHAAFADRSARA